MTMDPVEADELARRVQAGDREAFHRLFERLYRPLRIAVAVRAPDPELVDEVVQEAFVTAFERIGDYQPRGTFYPWLVGIARNRLARALRARTAADPLDAALAERLASTEIPAVFADAALVARLRRCLALLAPAARQLAQWRFAERRAVAAIAGELGRTAASVSVTVHRVRTALRECLERGAGG